MIYLAGRCAYACRCRGWCGSRVWCGWVWVSLGIYGQGQAKVGRSEWVRLIEQGWMIYLVGWCSYVCRASGGCGLVSAGELFSNPERDRQYRYLFKF